MQLLNFEYTSHSYPSEGLPFEPVSLLQGLTIRLDAIAALAIVDKLNARRRLCYTCIFCLAMTTAAMTSLLPNLQHSALVYITG